MIRKHGIREHKNTCKIRKLLALIGDSPYVIDTSNIPPHNVVPEPTVWASTVLMASALAILWFMKKGFLKQRSLVSY